MADLSCDLCNAEPAAVMMNNLSTGDVMAVGGACWPGFALGIAAQVAGELPDDQRAQYADVAGKVAAALLPTIPLADGAAGSISKQPRGRRRPTLAAGSTQTARARDTDDAPSLATRTQTIAEWRAGDDPAAAVAGTETSQGSAQSDDPPVTGLPDPGAQPADVTP